jgi:hypothetical protein
MPRLYVAIAFAAGLLSATLLGAAAPGAKPVTWEYRLVCASTLGSSVFATVESRVAATRAKYGSDAEARRAAMAEAWTAWTDDLADDGWAVVGKTLLDTGEWYVTVRPAGYRAKRPVDDFRAAAITEGIAAHAKAWQTKVSRELRIEPKDVALSGEYELERRSVYHRLLVDELNRCGAAGALLLPVQDLVDTTDRWLPVCFER